MFSQEFEKEAKNKEPSWWDKQKGVNRAMRASDKGFKKILAKDELVGSRLKHMLGGFAAGGAGGAGIGALASPKGGRGRGALIGGLVGGIGGEVVGAYQADKKYLKKKGITPKYLGLSSDFSDKAKKKYIRD